MKPDDIATEVAFQDKPSLRRQGHPRLRQWSFWVIAWGMIASLAAFWALVLYLLWHAWG